MNEEYPDFHGDTPIEHAKLKCTCATKCTCEPKCNCKNCGCDKCTTKCACGGNCKCGK